MRYFLHLAYNGLNYRGWQRQASVVSVQGIMEDSLQKIFKTHVPCMGCGRTDAMVHASQYFAQVDLPHEWDFDLLFRLNKVLPDDISVYDIIPVDEGCNVRFDATKRTYDYFIHNYKDPFLYGKSAYYYHGTLDFASMKVATALLLTHTDYRSFCICPDRHNTTICHIASAQMYVDNNGQRLRFQISANRFIRGMIRIIVAKLLEIGQGKMSIGRFEEMLTAHQEPIAFNLAYAQGLYLSRIEYPYLDVPPRTEFMGMMQAIENWNKI